MKQERHKRSDTQTLSPLLTPDEAGRILGVSRRTLRRMALRGEVPEVRLSARSVRYRAEDIERIISEGLIDARVESQDDHQSESLFR